MSEDFYDDYPREITKISFSNDGDTTPYYQCSNCKTEEKYILSKLENHEEWCPYRCKKEIEFLNKNPERNNKILDIAQKYLLELESDDNGYTWLEYSGKAKQIVDFAEAILREVDTVRVIPNIDTTITDKIAHARFSANKSINDSYNSFIDRLNEWKNGNNPYFRDNYLDNVIGFIDKYLDWYFDKNKKQCAYDLLSRIVYSNGENILDLLLHFIGYHVYDDGSFSIKWFFHGKEADEDDPHSYPVIVDDFYGTQNPLIIIDAMNKYEDKLKINKTKNYKN